MVGDDNICFETDYPHTDTTWPNSKEYVEKMLAEASTTRSPTRCCAATPSRMLELDRV